MNSYLLKPEQTRQIIDSFLKIEREFLLFHIGKINPQTEDINAIKLLINNIVFLSLSIKNIKIDFYFKEEEFNFVSTEEEKLETLIRDDYINYDLLEKLTMTFSIDGKEKVLIFENNFLEILKNKGDSKC